MATVNADAACSLTDSTKSARSVQEAKSVPFLVDADINEIAERNLRSNNFHVLEWSLRRLGETNGFLGQYYNLLVTVKIGDKSKHLKLFVKTPPPPDSREYHFLGIKFNKEIVFYGEIAPKMGIEIGSSLIPDYYLGKNNAVIVLGDAMQEGYVNPSKYVPFDEEQCILVAKAMSTFHSKSLILDEKLRRSGGQTIFDLYGHLLGEMAFVEGSNAARYLYSCVQSAHAIVDFHEGLKEDEAAAVKGWISTWVPKLPKMLALEGKFRNVICHRDLYADNIMLRSDPAGKPIACYLIDFQFLRWCPPAIDFLMCLFLTTDRAARRRCYDRLIDVYCDTMEKELAAAGLVSEDCLPRKEFLESCDQMKATVLTYSIVIMQVMLLPRDTANKYFLLTTDKVELIKRQYRLVEAYRTRLDDLIEEIKEHLANSPTQ